jgi:hypothetical protein
LNVTQQIISTSTNTIVNGVNRVVQSNITIQSYFAIAVYWINHGFTDVQKAEYEIITRFVPNTPTNPPRLQDGKSFEFTPEATLKQPSIYNKMK